MNYEVNIDPGKGREQMFYPEPPTLQSSISVQQVPHVKNSVPETRSEPCTVDRHWVDDRNSPLRHQSHISGRHRH